MNRIAAPAHITADRSGTETLPHQSLFARVLKSLNRTVIGKEEDDVAKWYEGSSWCDQTEHDLNHDAITGRRTRLRP